MNANQVASMTLGCSSIDHAVAFAAVRELVTFVLNFEVTGC